MITGTVEKTNYFYSMRITNWFRQLIPNAKCVLQGMLFRASMALVDERNCEKHAKRELEAIGYNLDDTKEGPNKWVVEGILDLLRVFSTQGHSGYSAPHFIGLFEKLAMYKPLGPLTGIDSEWIDHGEGMFQNIRECAVFKKPDHFNGQAYYLNGRVFREPDGVCYTNADSRVPITFPYTPTTEYVDVPKKN